MLEKILIPLDGSKQAERALDFALDLAKALSAKLWVMHIIDEDIPNEVSLRSIPYELERAVNGLTTKGEESTYVQLVSKTIFQKVKEKAKAKGVKFEATSNMGEPADKIIAFAKNMGINLIVIGITGLGEAKKFLFGSVADKVTRYAPCPVTIVR